MFIFLFLVNKVQKTHQWPLLQGSNFQVQFQFAQCWQQHCNAKASHPWEGLKVKKDLKQSECHSILYNANLLFLTNMAKLTYRCQHRLGPMDPQWPGF
jgi:hypothetical protein